MSGENSSSRVVLKYYLLRAVDNPGFIAPVYVLYLLSHGLSYAEIGAIGAIQSVVVLGGEIPTGYVGDRIGRRNSLLVAQVLFVISGIGMIFGESFLAFAVAFGLMSFGMTFVSGSADAWLYDILAEHLAEDAYTHVRGRGTAIGQWVMAVTMIAGAGFYSFEPVYPFVAVLGSRFLAFAAILSLPKNAQYADRGEGSEGDDESQVDDRLTVMDALPIIRERLTRPPLRSFVAYLAVFLGATLTVDAFIQPIAVDTLESNAGAWLASLGMPEVASLGVLYASFSVVSALASDRASDLEAWLGVRKAVLVVPMVTAGLLVVPAFVPLLAFPMFFVLKAQNSLLRPITGQYLNDHMESVGRATVLSAVSMVYALVRIPFMLGSGVVADFFSPLVAVATLGGTFLVVGGGLFLWRPPVRRESESDVREGAAAE